MLFERANRAIKKLVEAPGRAGSNLEAIAGTTGAFSARVTRNFRLLIVQLEDKAGAFYLIDRLASHDDAY